MRRAPRLALVLIAAGSVAASLGCGGDDGPGPVDAGREAATSDSGPPGDADVGDGGLLDGTPTADAAPADAGSDATPPGDAGPAPDAGTDAGLPPIPGSEVTYTETREACGSRNPLRNAYFGDLHVHTSYSFDAYVFDVRNDPFDAYRFARGEEVQIPDGAGGTRPARLRSALDFAAVTDHSEFLGEVELCTVEGSPAYDSLGCRTYRAGIVGFAAFGIDLADPTPRRNLTICGVGGARCAESLAQVWERERAASEMAYDRTAACSFTSFVAYEWTGTTSQSNLHRNVIFRNATVPEAPVSYIEEPTPRGLWSALGAVCLDAGSGCDVLAIPHNPNLSNGRMFALEYPGATTTAQERAQAELRASMEPLLEISQHKGTSECFPSFSSDEQCGFEIIDGDLCNGDGTGSGMSCRSRSEFLRGVLADGLAEEARLGVNPFRLGVIGSTDTHNGTPGNTDEDTWRGHVGAQDGAPRVRLAAGGLLEFAPGGLAGVWAVENSRDAIFEALRRRETFATSGPRIAVRLFASFDYAEDLCASPGMLETAYREGVPMGGRLPPGSGAPRFLASAMRDRTPLAGLQIVKGWLDADGAYQERVFDVAGEPSGAGASVDLATCEPTGAGLDMPCAVWTDPEHDPTRPAFYYARVLENPTCRWSRRDCNALAGARPASCDDPAVPSAIQERAWSSPIWYVPAP